MDLGASENGNEIKGTQVPILRKSTQSVWDI